MHLNNQLKYLSNRKDIVQHRRSYSQVSLKQRYSSQQLTPLTAPTLSSARSTPYPEEKKKVVDLFDLPSNYKTLKQTMPRRDKLYSKLQLKRIYPNPEQDESQALIWKKARCDQMKKITKSAIPRPTRGQILYQFTKFEIKFEKIKKKALKR